MFKSYVEVRAWLESFIPQVYGKEELGLARIENLLIKLGNPQKNFKSILVGGTAGKGSTAFYISQLLINKGYKTGLHVSPHLIYIGERMQIFDNKKTETRNNKHKRDNAIPVKRLIDLVNEIKPVVDAIRGKQPEKTPSYFEILVALSFLYFSEEKVEWAVVEVGLGGRLDATNILMPKISVITNVGLDHTEILGRTILQIAKEKAGIIKEGVPVVTAAGGYALKVIEKVSKENESRLINFNTLSQNNKAESDIESYIKRYYYLLRCTDDSFASINMNLALLSVLSLRIKVDALAVKKAFARGFSGRFEQIEKGVFLDGAHNIDKINALVQFIKSLNLEKNYLKTTLVVAFKRGKNWRRMIDLLIKSLPVNKVIATTYFATTDMGKGSAVSSREIADYLKLKRFIKVKLKVTNNSQKAIFEAMFKKQENEVVIVTGSLYLVGEATTLWKLPVF